MKWPWDRKEPEPQPPQSEHAKQQDAKVEAAQEIIDDVRDHSDRELERAQNILDDVRRAERALTAYEGRRSA